MKWVIFLLFTSAICAMQWMWQMDNHTSETAYLRLKNTLDLATHDAALQVSQAALDNGEIRFTPASRDVLEALLRSNLKLDNNNYPVQPNMFRSSDQLRVLFFDTVETGCPGSPAGFPCTYINSTYNYVDTIKGPSVVAIISMRHPRPFAFSQDKSFIVGGSHEYKGY
ncbi:hypothetical protein J2T17_004363 [Paenibacillus mucilaginosus]|uniref:hypothetical protein n=1 Tax=Paenibacillus mucilaginosus TaxID=61624 RepID=UPI003D1DD927